MTDNSWRSFGSHGIMQVMCFALLLLWSVAGEASARTVLALDNSSLARPVGPSTARGRGVVGSPVVWAHHHSRVAATQQRLPSQRSFPDSAGKIALLVDQLPPSMTTAQMKFAASHYVGSGKLLLPETRALRALNSEFIVMHYHLAIWQTAENHPLIINGTSWGNDYSVVSAHDNWFWRNASGGRVVSTADGKWLMNLSDPGFGAYWLESMTKQVIAGEYDAIFFDSASPPLIQGETVADPRLAGTGVKDNKIPQLGGLTYVQAWERWIAALGQQLQQRGIPLIPNYDNFVTYENRYQLWSIPAGALGVHTCFCC